MPENFEPQPEEKEEEPTMTFRDLRIEDCDKMLEIRNRAVLEEKVPFGNRKELKKEDFLPKFVKLLEMASKGEAIDVAAEIDGNLVGWIAGHNVLNAEVPTASADVIMMDKKTRSLKNFLALTQRWVDRVQQEWGSKKLATATQVENARVIKLYKRYGLKETGFFKKEGTEYVEMEKDLE